VAEFLMLRSRSLFGESYRWRDASQQPSARRRIVRTPDSATAERGDEGVLRELFGKPTSRTIGQGPQ